MGGKLINEINLHIMNGNKTIPIILVVAVLGILAGYFAGNQNATIESKEVSIFEKQRQCSLLRDNAKKKMEEDYKVATPFFYEIFYSPKTDSCLYHYGLKLYGTSPNEVGVFLLTDFFSGEDVGRAPYDNSSPDESKNSPDVRDDWNKIVDSYRP